MTGTKKKVSYNVVVKATGEVLQFTTLKKMEDDLKVRAAAIPNILISKQVLVQRAHGRINKKPQVFDNHFSVVRV